RYFNVFGPRQRPDSAYAAVVPLFISALREGRRPAIHGDGTQSRAFTFIADVVRANQAAAVAPADACRGQIYNIAGERSYSLLELLECLGQLLGVVPDPLYGDVRPGDIRDSRADGALARSILGWEPEIDFVEGLRRSVAWFEGR
ncbi:MAG TPA: NAD-dependent epimerase/dehydratase family protein, partial [Acidimicrobiales bacterium]|nr:NAD-dependent epimerase/dehydratase family protein [Acidimicrobiales bacterium]